MLDVADQLLHGQHGAGFEFARANVGGDFVARVADDGVRVDVVIHGGDGLFGNCGEILHLIDADGMVERVSGWHCADEDQHDEPHALLAVIGAVRETDAGAGKDEQRANPERRRLGAFRRAIELRIADELLGEQE